LVEIHSLSSTGLLEPKHAIRSSLLEDVVEITEAGKEKNTRIISVKGKMDAVSSPEFEKRLGEWMDEGETSFVIDFGELHYISSAGLRSILLMAKELKARNGRIICAAPRDEVKKLFTISGFSSMIPTYESLQVALEHI
jgi:anti-anti-sigma factor